MAGLRLVQGGEMFNLTKCMLHAWYIGSYLGECMLPNTCERSTGFFLLRVWYYVIFRGLLRRSTTSVFPDFHPGKVPFSATNGCSFDRQAWMIFPSKLQKSSKPVKVMCFFVPLFLKFGSILTNSMISYQVREAIKRNGGWTDPAPRWEFPPADSIWQGLLKWCCSSSLGFFSVNRLHHFSINKKVL